MKRVLSAISIIAIAMYLGLAHASEASQLYNELFQRSGLAGQLEQAPALIEQNFRSDLAQQGRRGLDPDLLDAIGREVRKAFSPGIMKAVIVAHLRKRLQAKDAREVLKWLKTPLGEKITRLDEEASTPQGQAELEKFAMTLDKSTMSRQQVNLIKRLSVDTHAVESVLDISLGIQKGVAAAALAVSSRDDLSSLPALFERIDSRREELRTYFEKTVLISMLYSYQSLNPTELQRYLKFVNTSHGSAYHRVMFEALKNAATQAALRLGSSLGKLVEGAESRKAL